jgi:predicted acyl esterase
MSVSTITGKSFAEKSARYKPLNPRQFVLKAGSVKESGALPLPCDIVVDYDIAIPLRDGTTIYADVYRPITDKQLPLVLSWAIFGKGGSGFFYLDNPVFPRRFGVPKKALSGYEAWEAPDPAYWCNEGYAVAQVDARGVFNSEGDVHYQGKSEAQDAADAIDFLGSQSWCNGRVGMTGNSWLAIQQWHTAALRPKHLAAIAPWEGLNDLFRDVINRGGITDTAFAVAVLDEVYSRGKVENPAGMLSNHPHDDTYWRGKRAEVELIETPAYVVASYANILHSDGTIDSWRRLKADKWLRIHNTHEWPDYYNPEAVEDLRKFFDHFLKEVDNGWESTPRVRIAVLDPGNEDDVNRVEDNFPPSRVNEESLFLDASDGHLTLVAPAHHRVASYRVHDQKDIVSFTKTFDRTTEIIGYPRAQLFVETVGNDDMDIFVTMKKLNKRGKVVKHQVLTLGIPGAKKILPFLHALGVKAVADAFYPGAEGMLRVSRRKLDAELSTPDRPVLALLDEQKMSPGDVVEVIVPIGPIAMRWQPGESLQLTISARRQRPPALPYLPLPGIQKGTEHRIHTGGGYPSRLIVPFAEN